MTKCPNCGLDSQFCACRNERTSATEPVTQWGTRTGELVFATLGFGSAAFTLAFWALCVATGLWGAACGGKTTPAPLGPPAPGQGPCARYCGLLARDHCSGWEGNSGQDEIQGTPDDKSCEFVCTDILSKGTYQADSVCLDSAVTCDQAESCILGE